MIGINISGAEFGGSGGTHDSQYHYPTLSELQFYKDHGVDLVRLPFSWERMQSTLGGPLNASELTLLKDVLANAATLGMNLIIDLHNYGRYDGQPLGSATGPTNAQFADFWSKLASEVKGYTSLLGYDLMNEPHDMPTADAWKDAAQAAVNAIRLVDQDNTIYVGGNDWSGAHSWLQSNANFFINDPAGKLVYQAHQYFDKYNQGFYNNGYEAEGAYPMIGVDRLKPFVDWLQANNLKGMIGEFGVPSNDPRWLEVQKNAIDYMNANGLDGTAWGGGTWWPSDYSMFMGAPGRADSAYFDQLEGYFGEYTVTVPVPVNPPAPTPPPAPVVNVVAGTLGNDVLQGTAGVDRIEGREGNDTLMGSASADTLDGGSGTDSVNYSAANAAVDVDLLRAEQIGSDAAGDRLVGIENLTGSSFADLLLGDSLANILSGGGGDDILGGRGGADRLDGGTGFDTATYADSASAVNVDLTRATQQGGDAQGDVLVGIEAITGSGWNDVLRGSSASNTLRGGDGDDFLDGGAGGDAFFGDNGIDTVTYANSSAGVDVNLNRAIQSGGDANGDVLSSIENLTGSRYGDWLTGDGAGNWLSGGAGTDVLDGGYGADRLTGGTGRDRFVFNSAANANGDWITDFNRREDRLDFSQIDANSNAAGDQAFSYIGARAFTGVAGQLNSYQANGNTYVAGDINGDGIADFSVTISGSVAISTSFIYL